MTTAKAILVIDDDPRVAGFIVEVLELEGYTVELAREGGLAVERLLAGSWDAVLCDVSLPGLDSAALYRQLQQSRPELLARTAFISGHDLLEVARRLQATPARTLKKPFGIDELRFLVADLLHAAV
jgi:CheY-like chemotaxis protein